MAIALAKSFLLSMKSHLMLSRLIRSVRELTGSKGEKKTGVAGSVKPDDGKKCELTVGAPQRFEPVSGNVEDAEDYRAGGYHPVHLGDVIAGRYKVTRKLGYGKFATVWLARDKRRHTLVVLKITIASGIRADAEIHALTKLNRAADRTCRRKRPVPRLLDHFVLTGPNGTHQVMVMEPLGRSLQDHLLALAARGYKLEYRHVVFLREICRQLVNALHLVHSNGIVHRDIQPGNILFAVQDDELEEDPAGAVAGTQSVLRLHRLDGKSLDASSPSYLLTPSPLQDGVRNAEDYQDFRIVLSDFGASCTPPYANDGRDAYPTALRPPELVLGLPISEKADIWNLGCVIYQIMTLTPLFEIDQTRSPLEQDRQLLESMTAVFGPLPLSMLLYWPNRFLSVNPGGELLQRVIENGISEPLAGRIAMERLNCMSRAEQEAFEDFIRCMMRYEAAKRPSTGQLLQHPWMRGKFTAERFQ